jgi:hypothetical protein
MGQQLLGHSADEMQQLKEEDEGQFLAIVNKAVGQMYNFNCRAKADTFQDQTKVRYHLQKAQPVNWAEAAKGMLETLSSEFIFSRRVGGAARAEGRALMMGLVCRLVRSGPGRRWRGRAFVFSNVSSSARSFTRAKIERRDTEKREIYDGRR